MRLALVERDAIRPQHANEEHPKYLQAQTDEGFVIPVLVLPKAIKAQHCQDNHPRQRLKPSNGEHPQQGQRRNGSDHKRIENFVTGILEHTGIFETGESQYS